MFDRFQLYNLISFFILKVFRLSSISCMISQFDNETCNKRNKLQNILSQENRKRNILKQKYPSGLITKLEKNIL